MGVAPCTEPGVGGTVVVTERLAEGPLVGRGSMADVFRGELRGARNTVRAVAIKRLRQELQNQPEIVDLFVSEARIGLALNHGNIVRTIEFSEDEQGYSIVVEWLAGGTLRQAKGRYGSFTAPVAAAVGATIGRALCYMHQQSDTRGRPLVHCDVGPDNVLIDENGTPKLCDLGLAAHRANHGQEPSGEGSAGAVRTGTAGFAAPEQWKGVTPLTTMDARCDIYGLAKLVEFLCPALASRPVLGRAMHQSPSRRLGTMQELVEDLAAAACPADDMEAALRQAAQVPASPRNLDQVMEGLLLAPSERVPPPVLVEPFGGPHRSKLWWLLLPLAAAAAGLLTFLDPWGKMPPTPLQVEAPTADHQAAEVDSPAVKTPPSSVDNRPAFSAEAPTPRLPAVTRRPAPNNAGPSAPVSDTPSPTSPVPATSAKPHAYGMVSLTATPWAAVYLQGRFIGNTPLRRIRLRSGRRSLVLKHPGNTVRRAEFSIVVDSDVASEQVFIFDLVRQTVRHSVLP